MVIKPNKPAQCPSSYRPISLLPVASKLFERLLLPRLLQIFEEANVIPNYQFGFRESHSTIHQLHRVVDFISDGLERKMYTSGVFLDVASAFDRVWHEGLLYKLKKHLPDTYYLLIYSFLKDRHLKVKEGNQYSDLVPISAGVPQGAILSQHSIQQSCSQKMILC